MTDFIDRYCTSAPPAEIATRFLAGAIESGLRYGYQVQIGAQKWNWQRTAESLACAMATPKEHAVEFEAAL